MKRLAFRKTGWKIDLVGCDGIAAQVPQIFHGWRITIRTSTDTPTAELRARISQKRNGWRWLRKNGAPKPRDWDRVPPKSEIRVLTDIHDAAIYWYLADKPSLLCLHGAAVQIGGTLICFPARGFAGKSTLVTSLAAHGHKVFADDVLGLQGRRCTGMALGFSPRLRTPLAPSLPELVGNYVASHSGPSGPGWTYLSLPESQQAPLGEKHPVGAFIMLERHHGESAQLVETNQATLLKTLVAENIIRQLPMLEIFNRLERLSRSAPRYTLRYDDPVEAARLLTERFS